MSFSFVSQIACAYSEPTVRSVLSHQIVGVIALHLVGDDWLGSGRVVLNGVRDRYQESEVTRVGKSKEPLYPLSRRLGVLEEREKTLAHDRIQTPDRPFCPGHYTH